VQFLAIIALSIAASVAYGIVHDQITVRVCLEYFSIAHPPLFHTTSPTLLALCWGVVATWWMGLFLGLGLATAARAGGRPKVNASALVRPIGILLTIMASAALLAGIAVGALASRGMLALWYPWSSMIPERAHVGFLADLAAHNASYLFGGIGGLVLIFRVWRRRLS
jgi:hypothetical protein